MFIKADLVGLKILAKAGYDPRAAIEVWQRMANLESELEEDVKTIQEPVIESRAIAAAKRSIPVASQEEEKYEDLEYGVREFLDSLVNSWFGSSHPPSMERVEYMRENLEDAIVLYEQALEMNGPPTEFIFSKDLQKQLQIAGYTEYSVVGYVASWISFLYSWSSNSSSNSSNNNNDSLIMN